MLFAHKKGVKSSLLFLLFFQTLIFKFEDMDSNLYHFSSRYYDLKAGRFLSADPVVPEAQSNKGLSRYAYVYNNPVKFDDPDGHVPSDRSREVRDYDEALEDYNSQLLAGLGYVESAGTLIFTQEREKNKPLANTARLGQTASFGLREVFRMQFAPLTKAGEGAEMLLGAHHVDESVEMLQQATKMNPNLRTADLMQAGLGRGATDVDVYRMGRQAAVSQTPIMFSKSNTQITYLLSHGYGAGSRIPFGFNLAASQLGIISSLEYENDIAKILGLTAGGLELGASSIWATNIYSPTASLAARKSAGAWLLRARTLSWVGGWTGVIAGLLEFAASQEHPEPSEEALRYRELNPDVGFKDWKGDPFDGCKGNYCLLAGTQVWTTDGLKKIEEIRIGESVPMSAQVTQVSENEVETWLQIQTAAETLSLTENHPVKVVGRGWVLAGEITVGDCLVSYKTDQFSKDLRILNIQKIQRPAKVYNLQVAPLNEFYVGASGILVRGLGK